MDIASEEFKANDFVFAKMSGYPPWPGIVMSPDPQAPPKQDHTQWIYFFGSHNYAWIEEKHIKPFETFKEKYKSTYKQVTFKDAVKELEDIIENMGKDPDYQIDFVKYSQKERKSSPKKPRKSSGPNIGQKRATPLKEKNSAVPRKKSRSSMSGAAEESDDLDTTFNTIVSPDNASLKVLDTTSINISEKIFGVLAANNYAEGIIKNLIKSGHRLHIWSCSSVLCEQLEEYADQQHCYLKSFNSPQEVARNSDIIFSCRSDPDHPKMTVLELAENDLLTGKEYVEMTSMDPERSMDLYELIKQKKGLYLEAMVQGSRLDAIQGELIILAAGSQQIFLNCVSCFKAMGKASFLLGDINSIGSASKSHMILQVMRGIFLAGLVEGFAMADKCGIVMDTFQNIFSTTGMSSDYLNNKVNIILHKSFIQAEEPLPQLQKELALGLEMSNRYRQPMPLASNANEILKHARRLGHDNQDASCIYNRTRY